jgi:hypothetical protein
VNWQETGSKPQTQNPQPFHSTTPNPKRWLLSLRRIDHVWEQLRYEVDYPGGCGSVRGEEGLDCRHWKVSTAWYHQEDIYVGWKEQVELEGFRWGLGFFSFGFVVYANRPMNVECSAMNSGDTLSEASTLNPETDQPKP